MKRNLPCTLVRDHACGRVAPLPVWVSQVVAPAPGQEHRTMAGGRAVSNAKNCGADIAGATK
jgi:hypothetical protein